MELVRGTRCALRLMFTIFTTWHLRFLIRPKVLYPRVHQARLLTDVWRNQRTVFFLFYLRNFEYICHSFSYIHDIIDQNLSAWSICDRLVTAHPSFGLHNYRTFLKKHLKKNKVTYIGKILWRIYRVKMITMAMIINADISWFKWVCSFLVNNYKFTFHHRQTVGFLQCVHLMKRKYSK